MKQKRPLLLLSLLVFLLWAHPAQAGLRFSVSYPAEAFAGPFTGRVVVYLSKNANQPRMGPNWFRPEPIYSQMFQRIKPGEAMFVDDNAVGFPGKPSTLEPGEYIVQAVVDRNLGGRTIGGSPGNLYSKPVRMTLGGTQEMAVSIVCDKPVVAREFQETEKIKGVALESKLLSAFYKRKTLLNAAVALPDEWFTDPNRKFPVIYSVPGFGGSHLGLSGVNRSLPQTRRDGEPFIFVVLDPDCPTGHTVFADSANNGPWGTALVTELIPEIEKRFRGVGKPEGRFVTGHSSGGWSSLWLQVAYPDTFGGCWSTSPDPVDFRDFQRINLYAPNANMFTDEAGKPRPLARRGTEPVIFYRSFSDMERPIRGEQLGSFEAVFSPREANGEPRKLWNRDTGAIDPKTADAWRKYDIDLILRTNWKTLEPKLRGKLHIYTGDIDTFYLEGAVRLLQEDMKKLGADAKIEIFPGDHGTVMTPELRARIDHEMAAQYRAAFPPK